MDAFASRSAVGGARPRAARARARSPRSPGALRERGRPPAWARAVLLILFLLAGSLSPPAARAQDPRGATPSERAPGFDLEQNSPNPVEEETWIPFTLEPTLFETHDTVTVSLRIVNVLSQVVAVPEAVDHPRGKRVRLLNLPYTRPGRNLAYWDGMDLAGKPVPSGIYYYQLVVGDEAPRIGKMRVSNPRRKRSIIPWFGH